MALETANLAGLSQTGAPVTMRGSMAIPTTAAARAAIISRPAVVSGALPFQSVCTTINLLVDVITVNITLRRSVDSVNINSYDRRDGSFHGKTAEKEAGGPVSPRRSEAGPGRGGGADDSARRHRAADAACRRGEAGGLADGLVPPFLGQAGAACGGRTGGLPDAEGRADRGLGRSRAGPGWVRGDGPGLRAVRRRPSGALPGDVRPLRRVVLEGRGVRRGGRGGVPGTRRFTGGATAGGDRPAGGPAHARQIRLVSGARDRDARHRRPAARGRRARRGAESVRGRAASRCDRGGRVNVSATRRAM